MGTLKNWRKAYGALKDTTKVGLAHVNSDYADLDVAIVKATNHVECPPKERHLRKITSAVRPRADVAYCIHALARRLTKTHNWTVALKSLIVIHRLLREGDPTFREEILNFSRGGRILQLSNFKDDSSPRAWDCSTWVRSYALFLEERLECFKILKYDIEAERLPRPAQGKEKGYGMTRDLESEELLEHLPALQNLLYRLIGCRVLKESFKIYCAINDGIINLVDKFFEMPRHEAVKALDIYKRAAQQAGGLSDFYEICRGLELARNFQFPVLREPPQSFLVTMDEYIREAPRVVSFPTEPLLQLTYQPEEVPEEENGSNIDSELLPSDNTAPSITEDVTSAMDHSPSPHQNNPDTGDLLGLSYDAPDASSIEEQNALALAIVPSGPATPFDFPSVDSKDFDPTGWELALVATSSNDISAVKERQLAGGLDTLTLNSLYDEGAYRASLQPVYGAPVPNPFEVQDPFAVSHGIAPPSVQMATIAQQPTNPFGPYQPASQNPQQQPQLMMGPANPFGDPGFGSLPASNPAAHPLTSNPFGSTGLL